MDANLGFGSRGVLAILLFWLLPAIAGHSSLVGWIANRASADLEGRVEVQSASLGWFSPITLYGVRIVDRDSHPVIEAPQVRGNRALLAVLWNAANLGRFQLEKPKFTVVLGDRGSNVEQVFTKYLKSQGKKQVDVGLQIADGSVVIEDARTKQTVQIDKLELDLAMPSDRTRPMELNSSGILGGVQHGGPFEFEMRLQQDVATIQTAKASPDKRETNHVGQSASLGETRPREGGPDTISVSSAKGISLAVVEPLLRRFSPGIRAAGRLSGEVRCGWNSLKPEELATLQANITGEDLTLSGGIFGKDQPTLKRLHAEGSVAWQHGVLEFDRVAADSDVGNATLSGTLDLAGRAAGAAQSKYELKGQLDLVRLAALLPNTLRIQKETQITSGRALVDVSSRASQAGMTWKGRIETSPLTAKNGTRQLTLDPVLATWSARQTAQGPVIENLNCQSKFLKIEGSGTPDQLTATASFDAGKLVEQLRGLVDLGGMRVAGDGSALLNWKRTERGAFDTNAELRINGFQWALPDRLPWTEKSLRLTASATGQVGTGQRGRFDTAALKLESSGDVVDVRLLTPVADFDLGRPWPLEVHSKGQLAGWPARLTPWFSLKRYTAAGAYEMLAEVVVSSESIEWRKSRTAQKDTLIELTNVQISGPNFLIREPIMEAATAGRWNWKTRRLELSGTRMASTTVLFQTDHLVCSFPPKDSRSWRARFSSERRWSECRAPPRRPSTARRAGPLPSRKTLGRGDSRPDNSTARPNFSRPAARFRGASMPRSPTSIFSMDWALGIAYGATGSPGSTVTRTATSVLPRNGATTTPVTRSASSRRSSPARPCAARSRAISTTSTRSPSFSLPANSVTTWPAFRKS